MPAWKKSHYIKLNLKEGQQILRASPTINDASLAIFMRILLFHATACFHLPLQKRGDMNWKSDLHTANQFIFPIIIYPTFQ